MTVWRRYLRYALIAFILGLGATVLSLIRDRGEPVRAVVVERADPDAVIQTRGSRIVQADSIGENLRVVAERQLTYPDGTLRMIDGVTVTIAEREDRPGFVLTGNEASVDANQTAVQLRGQVRFSSQDGLDATTEEASYLNAESVVRMPGDATFTRDGMRARGHGAAYDRSEDVLRLLDAAQVELTAEDASTRISSRVATLAQTEGFMRFEGGVEIEAGRRRMGADNARASFADGVSQLESLALLGSARIRGETRGAGELREMSANEITLAYGESGQFIEQAALTGNAMLELYGATGAAGTQIGGRSMSVELAGNDGGVRSLTALQNVVLSLPSGASQPVQHVRAEMLRASGDGGEGLDTAQFEGAVEYREIRRQDAQELTRVARAERLEAALSDGMSTLREARFYGDVTFEDQAVSGEADEAVYFPSDGVMELVTADATGRMPRAVDRRGRSRREESA